MRGNLRHKKTQQPVNTVLLGFHLRSLAHKVVVSIKKNLQLDFAKKKEA